MQCRFEPALAAIPRMAGATAKIGLTISKPSSACLTEFRSRLAAPAAELNARVVSGLCSDELYRAISAFEDKNFPGERKGYVDPGGPMLKRMEDLAQAQTPSQINFVTPGDDKFGLQDGPTTGLPNGPTVVVSTSSRITPILISGHALYVGIAGDNNHTVRSISTDIPGAVAIEDAGVAGSGVHWYRLTNPRHTKPSGQSDDPTIQALDAKGGVVASFKLVIIELYKSLGSKDFNFQVDPSTPGKPNVINLTVYTPLNDRDYIDKRMTGVGYDIYLRNGFVVYCEGMDTPINVPDALVALDLTRAEPIDDKVYDTLAQANDAIKRVAGKEAGGSRFAFYQGAGGAVIAPTIFSAASTPRIIETLWKARALYADYVQKSLTGVAIGIVGGMAFRAVLGRVYRASSEPAPPRPTAPPSAGAKIKPVNGAVDVGGGGEIPEVTNLNPIKPGSGGPSSGIPNHVRGGMEDMDTIFEPGSVDKMSLSTIALRRRQLVESDKRSGQGDGSRRKGLDERLDRGTQ